MRNARLTLSYVGLLDGSTETPPAVPFTRRDGSPGRINRRVDVVQTGPPPPADVPLVVQVSRWDRMKDMAGVMNGIRGARRSLPRRAPASCGPVVTGVADDPEAAEVLDECTACGGSYRMPRAAASTWRASRWPTPTRTRRS